MPPPMVNFNFPRNIRRAAARVVLSESDGDTPNIRQPIRMVSCDTPEKGGYAGNPPVSQPKLNICRARLENGFYDGLPLSLRTYLLGKLSDDAAARHINAALDATLEFNRLLETRLTLPDGSKRKAAVIPTGEIIDIYGRLLAYIAPWFKNTDDDPLPPRDSPERLTFNYNMIENGWAAFFPIYPSLPNNADMNMVIAAAETAWNLQKGAWGKYGADVLLGYEYRMCIKLSEAETPGAGISKAFERICVDLRDLRIVGEFGFSEVPPPYRLWIWEDDIQQAKIDLGLAN